MSRAALSFWLTVLVAGCGSSAPERFTLPGVRRALVFPFENLTGQPNDAGRRLTVSFAASLHRYGGVDVVEPGEVEKFILEERIRGVDGLTVDVLRSMAQRFKTDIVVVGTVNEFGYVPLQESVPVVGVSLRLVEPHGGRLLWSCTRTREGTDGESVFGIGKVHSLARLSEVVVADISREMGAAAAEIAASLERPEIVDTPATRKTVPNGGKTEVPTVDEDREEVHRTVKRHWQSIKERGGK